MIKTLTLENYRKVVDDVMHFTQGINVIRAANEASKSSRLEAISYALFGAAALKESLEDVVTYDVPVSKLRVGLLFSVAGIDYTITRSKSSAELTWAGGTVTGQKEVTKFVESLLGASLSMAGKLMLARQKDLGGALTEGATAAGKMIEDLADLGLLDELVALVGEHLPAGNTDSLKGTIETLRAQTDEAELPEPAAARQAAEGAAAELKKAQGVHATLKSQLDELDTDEAQRILAQQTSLQGAITEKKAQLDLLAEKLAAELPVAPAPAEIEAARAKVEAQKGVLAATKVHDELTAARVETLWDGDLASLEAELSSAAAKLADNMKAEGEVREELQSAQIALTKIGTDAKVQQTALEGRLIREESCVLCGKDLKDIPEVALVNNPISAALLKLSEDTRVAETAGAARIDQLRAAVAAAGALTTAAMDDHKALAAVIARNNALAGLYARAEPFVTFDTASVPALWTWTGPEALDETDYAGQLADLQAKATAATAAAATRQSQKQQSNDLKLNLAADQKKLQALEIKDAQETLQLQAGLKPRVQVAYENVQSAQVGATRLAAELHTLEVQRQSQQQAKAQVKSMLAKSEADLVEMDANNALIKKLRGARPAITDQLWAIVLAAVTTYFSDVRGERSVITRSDGKFRVNGKPVSGLSGSAEDALGLAIRYALTRTFLPNVDFIILDEVAAACDDQREIAMLGLLATSGFDQTILVTHSPLADSFSTNIITI